MWSPRHSADEDEDEGDVLSSLSLSLRRSRLQKARVSEALSTLQTKSHRLTFVCPFPKKWLPPVLPSVENIRRMS